MNIAVEIPRQNWDALEFQVIERKAAIRVAPGVRAMREPMRWLFDHLSTEDAKLEIRRIRGMQPPEAQAWIDAALAEMC